MRQTRFGILLLALGAVLASVSSCAHSTTFTSRTRFPLDEDPVRGVESLACIDECRLTWGSDARSLDDCVAGCPGAEVTLGAECEPEDQPPRAVCFEEHEERVDSDPAASNLLGDIVGGLIEGASEPSSSSPTGPSRAARSTPPLRSAPAHTRREYVTATPKPRR